MRKLLVTVVWYVLLYWVLVSFSSEARWYHAIVLGLLIEVAARVRTSSYYGRGI